MAKKPCAKSHFRDPGPETGAMPLETPEEQFHRSESATRDPTIDARLSQIVVRAELLV